MRLLLVSTLQVSERRAVIVPILQMRKLMQNMAKKRVQSHTALKGQPWDAHVGHLVPHTSMFHITHDSRVPIQTQ